MLIIFWKKISNNIREIDRSVKTKKLNKGIMFCANRNFTMIEKKKIWITY